MSAQEAIEGWQAQLGLATRSYTRAIRTARLLPPDEWAEENIIVTKGPRKGKPFRFADGYEFQRGILVQAFSVHRPGELERFVSIIKGSQAGITLLMLIGLMYWNCLLRQSAALVMPRDPDASTKSQEFKEMIRASPKVAKLYRSTAGKIKRGITGEELIIVGCQSERDLISWGAPIVAQDEYDRQGEQAYDVDSMLLKRLGAYTQWTNIRLGTPTIPELGIDEEYRQSNQQAFIVPCPLCGFQQELKWDADPDKPSNIRWNRDEESIEKQARSAWFECQECRRPWNRRVRKAANAKGVWVADEPDVEHIGFRISRLYVPSSSPIEFVREWLKSKGDAKKRREFWNQLCGLAWISSTGRVSRDRARSLMTSELQWGTPPSGTVRTVAGVDMQGESKPFDYVIEVRSYRADGFAYVIHYETVRGLDALVEALTRKYGGRRLDRALIDQTDGHHAKQAERAVYRVECLNSIIWDWQATSRFRHANLVKGKHGTSGWSVHKDLAMEDNLTRFFPDEDGKFRILIAQNPRPGDAKEWVDQYARIGRVLNDRGQWVYMKSRRSNVDYPYAGALCEVAFRIEISPRVAEEEEQRRRTLENHAKAERDRMAGEEKRRAIARAKRKAAPPKRRGRFF